MIDPATVTAMDGVVAARRYCHMVNTAPDASISRKFSEFLGEAVYPVDRETPLWHVGRRKWNKQRTGWAGATRFRPQTCRNRPISLLSQGQPSAGRKRPKPGDEEKKTPIQHVTHHKALASGTKLTRGAMQNRCPVVTGCVCGRHDPEILIAFQPMEHFLAHLRLQACLALLREAPEIPGLHGVAFGVEHGDNTRAPLGSTVNGQQGRAVTSEESTKVTIKS